jgi:hypothetical protein
MPGPTCSVHDRTGPVDVMIVIAPVPDACSVRSVTASRQSHAAQPPKNSASRSSPPVRTVLAARMAHAIPGTPPNGAESSPLAAAHAFTCRASQVNSACRSPTAASTASASLTALNAIAAPGDVSSDLTSVRSTRTPSCRNRSPGTRAPTTGVAPGTVTADGSGTTATRSRSAPARAQPSRRDPTTCTTPATDGTSTSAAGATDGAASGSHRTAPVPSSTVTLGRIGSSPRRDSTTNVPTDADIGTSPAAACADLPTVR